MKRLASRTLVFLLSLGLVLQAAFPLGVDIACAATDSVWTPLADIDAAAESDKSIAVTMTKSDGKTYALTATTSNKGPDAKLSDIQSDELFISGAETDYAWNITKTDNSGDISYTLQNSEGKYLYLTADNNGVRVGNKPAMGGDWKVTEAPSPIYLNAEASDGIRYLCVYSNTPNWRCYNNITGSNIKDQTLRFWAYSRDEDKPEVTPVDISVALAADSGEFMIKGAVTFIDGSSAYIQDATGAICVRAASAISGLVVGDTIKATGTRGVYNGLPQLNNSTYEKVTDAAEQITLSATETTINALSASDVCKYVTIKDLTVESVSGRNINVKDTDDNSIQIYNSVLGSTELNAGDIITFTGAVGIYKTTLQLRNTTADEITVTSGDTITPPIAIGDLITDLSELTDGTTVAIYNKAHKTAASSKPNGDWYLKAKDASISSEGKLENFTADYVWKVKVNSDGTYSFYANDDESKSITAWKSGTYAELSVDVGKYPDNKWNIAAAKTANSFYISSPTVSGTKGPAYIEAYVRNGTEVYSGYFVEPASSSFKETEFALQFYKVNPDDAVAAYDDGTWDGVMNPGKQYLIYNNGSKNAIGIYKEANGTLDPVASTLTSESPAKLKAGNGAYVFTVGSTGRYYTFKHNGKYLATNDKETMFFEDPLSGDVAPENAKWFLTPHGDGYIIYNKDASYGGTPVCIEYFSSAFSGWTYNPKAEDQSIFDFNFYEAAEGTKLYNDVVQDPSVIFDCKASRCIEQDFPVTVSLDDLCPDITGTAITYTAGSKSGTINTEDAAVCEVSSDKKNYTFTIPAADIDSAEKPSNFEIKVEVNNSYGISYTGSKAVDILDEPFIENVTPAPGSQTGDDKKPVISAKIGNVGSNPVFTLKLNDETLSGLEYSGGILSYTPQSNLSDGRKTAVLEVKREDDMKASKTWNFTVGSSDYQQYFGQLHSHTTYSDGSGTLDSALDYIESLPESANVQFVAFTDHSNYFDSATAANPADALNDASKMTDSSRALMNEYKKKAADFNAKKTGVIALSGFEMTWSGGPGHINTFQSEGIVSRNNADLNNKSGDAGMKLYYKTLNKGDSISQFNHPGDTFGNFTDFSYWDEETDKHIYLVEVGNGEGQIGAGGYFPSYEQYTMALDKGWHLAPTNNQDNHKGRWGNANDARDVILTNDFSEQGLYEAIRALRVYSTEDKNLKLSYTVNGEPMGTIFSDVPDKLELEVTAFDPDLEDKISKVEVIANGGKVVHTWNDADDISKGYFTAELSPDYTYYYIRTTQEDGNLAVTAPVWTGKSAAMGIDKVTADPETSVIGEEMTISTTLSNKTAAEAKLKSLTYSIGSLVLKTDSTERSIAAGASLDVDAKISPTAAKRTTVTVTAVIASGGNDYTFTKDVTFSVRENNNPLAVVPISTVQAQTEADYEYAVEGVVTSNASGYDRDTAFFDCIYVQDETAGICCFPVSGDYKIGDKVHIEGYTDFYQGEMELQVVDIKKIGEGTVTAKEVTAAQINDKSVLGSLITIKGIVESVERQDGLIQTIMVKDSAGDTARVFIDGYITTAKDVENCEIGAEITATGLASYDDTFNAPTGPFPRIRVRDRKDIVCVDPELKEAKATANKQLDAVDISKYSDDELETVKAAIATAKETISAAESVDDVNAALNAAMETIAAQQTNEQKAAQKLQNAKYIANIQLDAVDISKYSDDELETVKAAIANAKNAVNGATTVEQINAALNEALTTISSQKTNEQKALEAEAEADKIAQSVTTVIVNSKNIDAKTLDKIVQKAGGSDKYVSKVVLGKNVRKVAKRAFAKYPNIKTIEVKSKKLTKKSIKGMLKGSKVTTIKIKVGSKKANKKYVKKYKKIFTKKNTGRKVSVKQ